MLFIKRMITPDTAPVFTLVQSQLNPTMFLISDCDRVFNTREFIRALNIPCAFAWATACLLRKSTPLSKDDNSLFVTIWHVMAWQNVHVHVASGSNQQTCCVLSITEILLLMACCPQTLWQFRTYILEWEPLWIANQNVFTPRLLECSVALLCQILLTMMLSSLLLFFLLGGGVLSLKHLNISEILRFDKHEILK